MVDLPTPDGPTRATVFPLGMVKLEKVQEVKHVLEYIPAVIEPSFGIGRIIYSLLEHCFWARDGDEQRVVLSIPACIAPMKCLVAPLSPNDAFKPLCQSLVKSLRRRNISCQTDESSTSIGKRYARNDEVGVPFAVTVDFQSLKDGTVTVRERDSTEQIRAPLEKVGVILEELIDGLKSWPQVVQEQGGLFTAQNV